MYVVKNKDTENFLGKLKDKLKDRGCDFIKEIESNDLWIQDIFEFGYSASPSHKLDSILMSPRASGNEYDIIEELKEDRKLGFQAINSIIQIRKNNLASFGNFEVSPPTFGFPFGRILLGGRPLNKPEDRKVLHPVGGMNKEVVRFLHAQKIQPPLHLITDWLDLGHVDEILTFIPIPKKGKSSPIDLQIPEALRERLKKYWQNEKEDPTEVDETINNFFNKNEFLVLIADTNIAEGELKNVDGNQKIFPDKEITVSEYLKEDNQLRKLNKEYQKHLVSNKTILQNHLILTENQFIKVPVLFAPQNGLEAEDSLGAVPFFPNMINCLVLGDQIIMPKPQGPEGIFETYMKEQLKDYGIDVIFIEDDGSMLFKNYGGFHCATNVKRKDFGDWWKNKDLVNTNLLGNIPLMDLLFQIMFENLKKQLGEL